MNREVEWSLAVLARWRDGLANGEGRDIATAIVDWTKGAFEHERDATARDVLRHLATTDCAACHAPPGLICNRDIAGKVPEWWRDIDAALAAYADNTGDDYKPQSPPLTVGALVWFAVEWFAHDAASYLERAIDVDKRESGE